MLANVYRNIRVKRAGLMTWFRKVYNIFAFWVRPWIICVSLVTNGCGMFLLRRWRFKDTNNYTTLPLVQHLPYFNFPRKGSHIVYMTVAFLLNLQAIPPATIQVHIQYTWSIISTFASRYSGQRFRMHTDYKAPFTVDVYRAIHNITHDSQPNMTIGRMSAW